MQTEAKYQKTEHFKSNESFNGNLTPQAIEMERAVLGAIMIDRSAMDVVSDIIRSSDVFYGNEHREIYKAIWDLYANSEKIDMLTVTQKLREFDKLKFVGGPNYIMRLTSDVNSAFNVDTHARIVQEMAMKRALIQFSFDLQRKAFDISSDVFDLLEETDNCLLNLVQGIVPNQDYTLLDYTKQVLTEVEKAKAEGKSMSILSNLKDLDNATGGWFNGDLILIGARPAMGKTLLAMHLLSEAAKNIEEDESVGKISLEMSGKSLAIRDIGKSYFEATGKQISSMQIRKADLTDEQMSEIYEAESQAFNHKSKILINDTPAQNLYQIKNKARQWKRTHKLKMLVVDYLQLVEPDGTKKNETRNNEVEKIAKGLKDLAKELDIPVIALAQLSRAVETRGGDKKPHLSDLRDSGGLEQNADGVIFLYRPEYYGITQDMEGNLTKNLMQLIIAKYRQGSVGEVNIYADCITSTFKNWETIETRIENLNERINQPNAGFKSNHHQSLTDDLPF